MNKTKREEFLIAAKPLMEFLNNNYNPHTYVMVDSYVAELVEGQMSVGWDESYED